MSSIPICLRSPRLPLGSSLIPMALLLLLLLCPCLTWAQTPRVETALNIKLVDASVIRYDSLTHILLLDFDSQDFDRYGTVLVMDTTLIVKESAYGKDKKKIKLDEVLKMKDLRPGMYLKLTVDYFQISDRCQAVRIALNDEYYGKTEITGIFEWLDGKQAMIDGHRVELVLPPGKAIDGKESWKGKKFTSFAQMQLGAELSLKGERRLDGVVYVTSGTIAPVLMSKEDYLLRRAADREMRVTSGILSVSRCWKFAFISNTQAQDYVATVGKKLIPAYLKELPLNHPDHIDFKFYLVNDSSFNASAYPNGAIVVHKGLLDKVDNEDQLAAILGHEMAHITQKHFAANFRNHNNWQTVLDFGEGVAGYTDDETPLAVATLVAEASMSSFGQDQESQADRIGLHYMANAGYDPRQATVVWKRLAEQASDAKEKRRGGDAKAWIQKSFQGTGAELFAANESNGSTSTKPQSTTTAKPPSVWNKIGKVTRKAEEAPTTGAAAATVVNTAIPMIQPVFPTHPKPRKRLQNVRFLLGTAYQAQLTEAPKPQTTSKLKEIKRLLNPKPAKPQVAPAVPVTSLTGSPTTPPKPTKPPKSPKKP